MAVPLRQRTAPRAPVVSRATENAEEKERIAATASAMVEKEMRIYLNGGSTVRALARRLASGPAAQYTTNSIEEALTIANGGVSDAVLLGGTLRRHAGTLIGPESLEMIERRTFDIAFVGITAIHVRFGFLDPTEWHVYVGRVLRQRSRRLVVLADHSKFFADSDIRSFDFNDVDTVVTDRPPPDEHAEVMARASVEVVW